MSNNKKNNNKNNKNKNGLTKQNQLFADEYLQDFNASAAAIRAGYSPKSAYSQGCRLLKKAKISTYIEKQRAERSRRLGVNADTVIRELARLGFYNAKNVVDNEGDLINASEDDTAAVVGIKVKKYMIGDEPATEKEYKLADKIKALELLGKYLGIIDKKSAAGVSVNAEFAEGSTGIIQIAEPLPADGDEMIIETQEQPQELSGGDDE